MSEQKGKCCCSTLQMRYQSPSYQTVRQDGQELTPGKGKGETGLSKRGTVSPAEFLGGQLWVLFTCLIPGLEYRKM